VSGAVYKWVINLTYYVVAHWREIIICSLIPIASLPTGALEYSDVLVSEGTIRTLFTKKRGVYIWTNKRNGKQYVGSALDLSSRLSDYFKDSYLKHQTSRGSAISAAILKYGLSEFSLQITVLGPSPTRESISTSSDHIQLEQYFLDRYCLAYNIRRMALGPAPTANLDYNKSNTNPQFGKAGADGAAWNHKHTPEQKALWSLTRSTPIFVYDACTLTFHSIVFGYERLASLLGVHVNTARRVCKSSSVYAPGQGSAKYIVTLKEVSREKLEAIKANVTPKSTVKRVVHVYNKQKSVLLKTFSSVNEFMKFSKQSGSLVKQLCESESLWLDEYFISYDLIPGADNSLGSVGNFQPKLRERKTSVPVYTYSADGTFIKRYSSLRECVKELEGNRNTTTITLMLRIEHKELYHGLRVSYTQLFEHPI